MSLLGNMGLGIWAKARRDWCFGCHAVNGVVITVLRSYDVVITVLRNYDVVIIVLRSCNVVIIVLRNSVCDAQYRSCRSVET